MFEETDDSLLHSPALLGQFIWIVSKHEPSEYPYLW